jgi:uncharacterized protein (TIGR02594 family)
MTDRSKLEIEKIQKQLAQKGFDPGPIDGIWGRRSDTAVRNFQAKNGLEVDGIVGPATQMALFGKASSAAPVDSPALVWFQEARRLLGVREGAGVDINNRKILDWADDLGIPYKSDDIPWCGLFVAHCIGSTLTREPLPANPLGARSWLKFGARCTPAPGAVLIFWRGSRTGWKGHVGFYAGEEANGVYHVLGGNQSDKVSIARISADRLLEARWPATVISNASGPLVLAAGDTILSQNEA